MVLGCGLPALVGSVITIRKLLLLITYGAQRSAAPKILMIAFVGM